MLSWESILNEGAGCDVGGGQSPNNSGVSTENEARKALVPWKQGESGLMVARKF